MEKHLLSSDPEFSPPIQIDEHLTDILSTYSLTPTRARIFARSSRLRFLEAQSLLLDCCWMEL